jgi:predicted GNAT family acetyltransferase
LLNGLDLNSSETPARPTLVKGYDFRVVNEKATEQPAGQPANIVVVDNPGQSRYEARLGDRVLGIVEYDLDATGKEIILLHTEVLEEAEGKGVGGRLARGVLEDLRARRVNPIVECPFISAYIKRHRDEYRDLLPG